MGWANKALNALARLRLATGAGLVGSSALNLSGSTVEAVLNDAGAKIFRDGAAHALPVAGCSRKMFWRAATNVYYVITPKSIGNGYLLVILKRGVVTASASVGGAAELLRVVQVLDLLDAWGGTHDPNLTSGTWTEEAYNYPGSAGTGGVDLPGWWWVNSTVGAWIEWVDDVKGDGEYNVKFYTSAGSSSDVDISVDGVVVDTVSLVNSAGGLYTYTGRAGPGQHTIRVTNNTDSNCYVFGVNYFDLKDHPLNRTPKAFVYWRTDTPYITNEGASDYAFYNANDSLWGGSYHGGETLVNERFLIDGAFLAPAIDELIVFETLVHEQQTTIAWPGGDSFTSDTAHHFSADGGYDFRAVLEGDADLKTAYTVMSTTQETFTDVKFPVNHRFSGLGIDLSIGRNNAILQRDPSSLNSIYNRFTLFNQDHENQVGPYVREAVGFYNKLYYGPVVSHPSGVNVTSLAFTAEKRFF